LVQWSWVKTASSIPRRDVVAKKGDDDEKTLEYLFGGASRPSLVAGRTALKKFETSPVFDRFGDIVIVWLWKNGTGKRGANRKL
jgi:hypothetical protein